MEKENATNYEYHGESEIILSEARKKELINNVNKIISKKNSIALHKILGIADNEAEYQFLFDYLENSNVLIRGINSSLAGEIPNYEHLPKDGQSYLPNLLAPDEEIKLFEMKATGNEEEKAFARAQLIEHNMRLVNWLVGTRNDLKFPGFSKEDLISYGNEALIKAVDAFDYTRGYEFSTYAVQKIYWEIRNQTVRKSQGVYIPVHMIETINKVKKIKNMIAVEKEKQGIASEVTADEIAKVMGISEHKVEELLKIIRTQELQSIEAMLSDDYDSTLDELTGDETITLASGYNVEGANIKAYGLNNSPTKENVDIIQDGILLDRDEPEEFAEEEYLENLDELLENVDLKRNMREILDTLTPREEKVLSLRFGLEDGNQRNLEEVGKEFNVTRERIRQIEAKALRKLRHPSRIKKIKYIEIEGMNHPRLSEYIDILLRTPKEKAGTVTSADLTRSDITTIEVLSKIKEVIDTEQDIDKCLIFLERAVKSLGKDESVDRAYLLINIYKYMKDGERASYSTYSESEKDLISALVNRNANEIFYFDEEASLQKKSYIIVENILFKLINGHEPSKDTKGEVQLAKMIEKCRRSTYADIREQLEKDIEDVFMEKYKKYPEKRKDEKERIKDLKEVAESTKKYFSIEYDYRPMAMLTWVKDKMKHEIEKLGEPNLSPDEKVVFDAIMQGLDELIAAKREKEEISSAQPQNGEVSVEETPLTQSQDDEVSVEENSSIQSNEEASGTEKTLAQQLEEIIKQLKEAYSELEKRTQAYERKKVEVLHRIEELKTGINKSETKIDMLHKFIEENRAFLRELGEIEPFESKLTAEQESLAEKRSEEEKLSQELVDIDANQQEIEQEKQDIKKKVSDIAKDI